MSYDAEAIESERLDADLEMADLQATANQHARLQAKGICTHGWRMGRQGSLDNVQASRPRGRFPDRTTNTETPPVGFDWCLDCGQHVKGWF